jgi:hypothetical protein
MFRLGATDTGGRLIPSDNLSFSRRNLVGSVSVSRTRFDEILRKRMWPYGRFISKVLPKLSLVCEVCEVHVPCIWLLFCALSGLHNTLLYTHRILQISRTLNPQLYFTSLSILLLFVTIQCGLNVKLDQQSANLTRDCRDVFVRYSRLAKDRTGRSANYRYKQQTAVTLHFGMMERAGVSETRTHSELMPLVARE